MCVGGGCVCVWGGGGGDYNILICSWRANMCIHGELAVHTLRVQSCVNI